MSAAKCGECGLPIDDAAPEDCSPSRHAQQPALRPATEDETAAWLAGHSSPQGAVETPEGLLLPVDGPA